MWDCPTSDGYHTMNTSVKVDGKGRLTIPIDAREAFGVREGDVFYFDFDLVDGIMVFAPAKNPLLQRLEEGRAEYKAGLTKSLDEVAAELGIVIDRD